MDDGLLDLLATELGEIYSYDEECPGVYYLSVLLEDRHGEEYYLVFEDAPISQEARALGRRLKTVHALVYPINSDDGARIAVQYEILKYKTAHGLPLPKYTSLRDLALYGMELCPKYFGAYPVPSQTPWGYTLRHYPLANGIYWLETERCAGVLAVCHPIGHPALSQTVLDMAGRLAHEDDLGCLFFREEVACVAIWELLPTHSELTGPGLILKPELMNAIWMHHPEYAMGYNVQEQAGLNNGLDLLIYTLGVEDWERKGSVEKMLTITPEVGMDFISFWK